MRGSSARGCWGGKQDRVSRARGIRASLGYGLTETSSGVALSVGDDCHAMKVCPEDEVWIAGDGEICVKVPTCLMQGYYRDDAKTADAVRDGLSGLGFVIEDTANGARVSFETTKMARQLSRNAGMSS